MQTTKYNRIAHKTLTAQREQHSLTNRVYNCICERIWVLHLNNCNISIIVIALADVYDEMYRNGWANGCGGVVMKSKRNNFIDQNVFQFLVFRENRTIFSMPTGIEYKYRANASPLTWSRNHMIASKQGENNYIFVFTHKIELSFVNIKHVRRSFLAYRYPPHALTSDTEWTQIATAFAKWLRLKVKDVGPTFQSSRALRL